jgi:hypothetical protein
MEILIGIMPLTVFIMVYIIISIQEWIDDIRFYHRRTQKELNRIRRSVGKVECVKSTVPTGKVYVFGGPKIGTVTGTVGYEQLEEMGATLNEAEKLIKNARDWKIE